MEPIFVLDNVTVRFGSLAALEQVNLTIQRGERVALIGPSGAGKSTLLSLLNGTQRPTQGEVRVLGRPLARLSPRERRAIQRRIGTVYQQFHLVENLRVIHNVNAGRLGSWPLWKSLISLAWPLGVDQAAAALAQVGIPEKLFARTSDLSGGQQQRVALARVLVQNPDAILADEPISNLDPERGREIMDLLVHISETTGKTLVVSLHAIEFTQSHFHRIVGLRQGRVQFDCPAGAVDGTLLAGLYQL
ncbi:MAG: phosphonates import ATP-binding protein PhnC 1 [Litorilinea sp.]|nr:MAG: phosphonates import ATP-binding protein PhnC 1 [Litorilinea sp.]